MRVKVRTRWLNGWTTATVISDPDPFAMPKPSWAWARVVVDGLPSSYWFAAKDVVPANV